MCGGIHDIRIAFFKKGGDKKLYEFLDVVMRVLVPKCLSIIYFIL